MCGGHQTLALIRYALLSLNLALISAVVQLEGFGRAVLFSRTTVSVEEVDLLNVIGSPHIALETVIP